MQLTIELSDEVWERLKEEADSDSRTPEEIVKTVIENIYGDDDLSDITVDPDADEPIEPGDPVPSDYAN